MRHIPSSIRWILSHTHVGTPYEDVAQDIVDRVAANAPDMDQRTVDRNVTDALIQHRRNRAEYAWVMGGH